MKRRLLLFPLLVCAAGCDQQTSEHKTTTDRTTTKEAERTPVAADNTKKNERDRGSEALTAGDQSEKKEDIEITSNIRKEVMKKDLSMTAKNIKIMTVDGVVTLRGPVKSATEKVDIATCVKNVQGVKKINNQLEVAAK